MAVRAMTQVVIDPACGDEELVFRARGGDEQSLNLLLHRYRRFARAKARAYFLVGGDREDIIQEGMIGLYKAIRDFSVDGGASFRSFAELCITRQILTAIKTATRQKHTPLNSYVSISAPRTGSDGDVVPFAEQLAGDDDVDPLALLVESDDMRELRAVFQEVLSGLEERVLDLYVEGRSYQEIADLLGRQTKSIDNALQRIKRKLESHLLDRVT